MAAPKDLYPGDDQVKVFTLPVSGTVTLVGPEVRVAQTREFQRLAGVKQLGTSYVVFRGATHTRFEHSLGALHKAEEMVQAINRNPRSSEQIEEEPHKLARLGSLLHDLTHIPFGHTLEDEFHLLKRHDENTNRITKLLVDSDIGEILKVSLGADLFQVLVDTLVAKKDKDFAELKYPFVGDIVGNTVCADLLDYVERDLSGCGMPVQIGDRFLDYLTLTSNDEPNKLNRRRVVLNLDKRGMPRPDVESEVIKLLNYRYELAERVYFHHAKNSASVMIARAVQEAGLAFGEDTPLVTEEPLYWVSDEALLLSLAHPTVEVAMGLKAHTPAVGDRELASRLGTAVLERSLFKIAYLGVHDDLFSRIDAIALAYEEPANRKAFEDSVADKAGVPRGSVLLHVPRRKMMTKAAAVRVRTSSGDVLTLSEWDENHSRRVSALNDAHQRLWRVTVFLHPDHMEKAGLVRVIAEDMLGAPSRYVEDQPPGYLGEVFDLFAVEEGWEVRDRAALVDAQPLETAVSLADTREQLRDRILLWREQNPPA